LTFDILPFLLIYSILYSVELSYHFSRTLEMCKNIPSVSREKS
jgi:hypothetical protein